MCNVRTIEGLKLPMQTVRRQEITERFPNLAAVPFPSFESAAPRVLIGLDNNHLTSVEEHVPVETQGISAIRTKLGWTVYGATGVYYDRFHVNVIDSSYVEDEADRMCEIERLVNDYLEKEDCCLLKDKGICETEDVRRAIEIMQRTTKRIEDQFETGLIWKLEDIVLPDSRTAAMSRFVNLERKWTQDPSTKQLYQAVCQNYLDQVYARNYHPKKH